METISFIGAAQRLGVSVEEVTELIKDKKLKEVSKGKVSKDAVYALSELSPTGNQTKSSAGRKPNVMTMEATAAFLDIDIAAVNDLIREGELEICEGAGGVRGPKEAQVKKYAKNKKTEPSKNYKEEKAVKEVNKDVEPRSEEKNTKNENEVASGADDAKSATIPETNTETTGKAEEIKSDIPEGRKDTKSASSDKNGEDKDLGFSLEEVMKQLFPGVKLFDGKMRAEMLKECAKEKPRYTKQDMKEVADIAYMKGKLAVYESMDEFKRKVRQ